MPTAGGDRCPQTPTRPPVPDAGDEAAAPGYTVRRADSQEGRDRAWQAGSAADKHPKFGMKTAGGGKEGSWALVITLDLGSEREKGAFVGLSRTDNPGRATARAEALRPGAFSRVSGEPEPGVGVGVEPRHETSPYPPPAETQRHRLR